MRKRFVVFVAAAMLSILVGQARAALLSTFDASSEGWTGQDPATGDWTASWHSSGGNPGGYMDGIETNPQGGTGYFIAPASWSGNWSGYVGGTLAYDEKVISGTDYFVDQDVIIYSGSNYVSWTSPTSLYSSDWANHSVALTASNFTGGNASFDTVMSNVTALWIRGELISGAEEEGLDNVSVQSPNTAIPEPSTFVIWSLLGGGAALGYCRRRKRGHR